MSDKLVIKTAGTHKTQVFKFIEDLFEAFSNGYRLADSDQRNNTDLPLLSVGIRSVTLYKDGKKPSISVSKENPVEDVEPKLPSEEEGEIKNDTSGVELSLAEKYAGVKKKKSDLLKFAADNEIPLNATSVEAIQEEIQAFLNKGE